MKKLSLLVAVLLLVAGMAFADVTFDPAVTGEASVTWGYDFDEDNSGFAAEESTSLDLGITVDPVDAKSGEGIYGEVALSGLSVTAKSGSDVEVAAPTIDAKLFFSEGLYLRVATAPELTFDYASPLGELIDFNDDTISGSWYDGDEDYTVAEDTGVVVDEYFDTGYGITYEMGALSVSLDYVSANGWGTNDDADVTFDPDDYNALYEADDYAILPNADYVLLLTAVATAAGNNSDGDTYDVVSELVDWDNDGTMDYKVWINDDDEIMLLETETDGDDAIVYAVDNGDGRENSQYTFGLSGSYTMEDVGTFMAYVVQGQDESEYNSFTFKSVAYGFAAEITAVDMVGLNIAADFASILDSDLADAAGDNDFEYELEVSMPITVSEMLNANLQMAATDTNDVDDDTNVDLYADVTGMVSDATVTAAYMLKNMGDNSESAYTLGASYTVNGFTPSAEWLCGLGTQAAGDEYGQVNLSVVAAIVDNTTFTAKYNSGDLLVGDVSEYGQGAFTFETKLAY